MPFQIHVGPNIRKSPYFDATVADGVRSFSVYNHMYIPGNFGDPEGEYRRLLNGVAMWDVGAQRQVEIAGPDAEVLVRYLTTRDLSGTRAGQGRYVPLCNHDGILINDPVLLKLSPTRYWLSIADSDIALWAEGIARERGLDLRVFEPDVSPMAIQGPKARDLARDLFGDWILDLKYFWFREVEFDGIPLVVARSGWSKQGGFELYLMDGTRGSELWGRVKRAGRAYGIGPGAPNDQERLESGLLSYGADARYQQFPANPFELGLGAMVNLDRPDEFVGRTALRQILERGVRRRRVGLFIDGEPVASNGHPLDLTLAGEAVGVVCEVGFSPRLRRSIAIALLDNAVGDDEAGLSVDLGHDRRRASVARLPFA
ncbi:glycine cleavage T C-terminal barrel domain-containing protein [Thalassobaculum sp.]|uniref:glycine cleavage T C-terminal barrel domain-containing protein n=1 Tax=Thalassobaculum sp. TaxID=2022740 RepID=UPI0032EE5EA9